MLSITLQQSEALCPAYRAGPHQLYHSFVCTGVSLGSVFRTFSSSRSLKVHHRLLQPAALQLPARMDFLQPTLHGSELKTGQHRLE